MSSSSPSPLDLSLYAITPSCPEGEEQRYLSRIEAILAGGVSLLQYREKLRTPEARLTLGRAVLALCRTYGVPLIVNDDPHLMETLGADGVHLGQEDLHRHRAWLQQRRPSDGLLGITAKTPEQIDAAVALGAHYLGMGDVFGTQSKQGATFIGLSGLKALLAHTPLPAVAIGGITYDRLPALEGLPLAGVAVLSALFDTPDPEAEAKRWRARIHTLFKHPAPSETQA